MVLRCAIVSLALLLCAEAYAERATTRDALDRVEGVLEMRLDEGTLRKPDLLPMLVVSTKPRYEESKDWYESKALALLASVFGPSGLRVCEACMVPRIFSREGFLEHSAGPVSIEEVVRLDASARGSADPARTAIWLDENASGVGLKIVDLSTSQVLYADNIDPNLRENKDTADMMRLSEELERRARGESITQAFVDFSFLGVGGHFSMDWTDQWGDTNMNFTGFTFSMFDPIVGVGIVYYRVFDIFHMAGMRFAPQIGGKVVMSLPTAIVQSVTDVDEDLIDPMLTGVFVLRVPIGSSNYGVVLTASTNLNIGVGISLLNINLLPVIP